MALAVDATSPARVTGATTNATLTATTASFTPPAGSVLVAAGAANARTNGGGNGIGTGAVSNSGTALTWTKINERNLGDTGGLSGYAGIFVATVATSAAMTVTLTMSAATAADINSPTIKVYVVTGADTAGPVGGNVEGSSTAQNATSTAFTTVRDTSLGFMSWCDWNSGGAITSSDTTFDKDSIPNSTSIHAISGYKTLGAAGSSATFNASSAAATPWYWNYVTTEIMAPAAAVVAMPMLATYVGPR